MNDNRFDDLKVLYVNPHLEYADGSGVHANAFLKWARRSGARVHPFPRPGTPRPAIKGKLREVRRRLPPSLGEAAIFARERFRARGRRRELFQEAAEFLPDVVVTRSVPFDFLGYWIAERLGVPCVLEANGVVAYDQHAMFGRPTLGLMERAERKRWLSADGVVTLSAMLRDIVIEAGAAPEKVTAAPLGYDHEAISPDTDGDEVRRRYGLLRKKVLGFAGHIGQWHGPREMARIFAEAMREVPDARVLIVGEDDDRGTLGRALSMNGAAADRVVWTGAVPHREIPAHLAVMDVALFYESRPKPFSSPIKVFEYMGSGKATVGPDRGQCPELFAGDCGVLAKHRDPESFARAAIALLRDDARRNDIGRRAAERARRNYTWLHRATRVLDACRDALSDRNRSL